MIVFHKLRYRNFLATGNVFTEIQLDADQTTLIIGLNGAGKTTLIEALCYVLFNRSLRGANKPTLINSIIGKNMLVELEFSVNGTPYFVSRGMKPNVFEIRRYGTLLDQGTGVLDQQATLEKQILKMNFKSFTQIVILGSGDYVPFLKLPAQARREVIEDLLDIQVFSTMNNILKDRIKENDKALEDVDFSTAINENCIKQHLDYQARIARMNAGIIGEKTKKLEELEYKLGNYDDDIAELRNNIEDTLKRKEYKQEKLSDIEDLLSLTSEHNDKLKMLRDEEAFYRNHETCPACHQIISDEFREEQIYKRQHQATKIESALKEVGDTYGTKAQTLLEDIKNLDDSHQSLTISLYNTETVKKYQLKVRDELVEELADLNQKLQPETNGELVKFEEIKKELEAKKAEILSKRELYNSATILLKDGGIKSRIVRQYIPIINQLINKSLEDFDFFVSFYLDENFNEQIKSRGRDDFNYESFSEGEKVRINLAVLFAWMSIARMRNSVSCSLLIMDEILDGSLDAEGTEAFLKLLKPVIGDRHAFVISHKMDLHGKFDKVLEFKKIKNFSHMEAA